MDDLVVECVVDFGEGFDDVDCCSSHVAAGCDVAVDGDAVVVDDDDVAAVEHDDRDD